MNREELIEEAAKAAFAVQHPNVEWWGVADIVKRRWIEQQEAALAVFEKAHAPTDDEREALEAKAWREQYTPGMSQKEARAFKRGHAAGWRDRRSEVPEPSTECPSCGHLLHALNGGPCGVILSDVLGEVRYCHCERSKNEHIIEGRIWKLLAESVQGEKVGTTIPVPVEDIRTLLARRSEPQGEPSDAQLKAAFHALYEVGDNLIVSDQAIRAALRAAGLVNPKNPEQPV